MNPSATPAPAASMPFFSTCPTTRPRSAPSTILSPIFVRSLRDEKRHDAVNAEGRQKQRHRATAAEQRRLESISRDALIHDLLHRPNADHGQFGIHRLDDVGRTRR
jgi:hypothetical protein